MGGRNVLKLNCDDGQICAVGSRGFHRNEPASAGEALRGMYSWLRVSILLISLTAHLSSLIRTQMLQIAVFGLPYQILDTKYSLLQN